MNEEQIREVCQKLNMEIDDTMGKGKLIDEIFGEFCEGTYIQPTFITDYPKEMSPLTKIHRSNPDLTERFELMVNGKELCNAYSELNDPIDQLERFEEQMRLSEKGDDEAMIIDKDFVRALEYGMPPTSGMGIGMDRLTMLMTGQSTICLLYTSYFLGYNRSLQCRYMDLPSHHHPYRHLFNLFSV